MAEEREHEVRLRKAVRHGEVAECEEGSLFKRLLESLAEALCKYSKSSNSQNIRLPFLKMWWMISMAGLNHHMTISSLSLHRTPNSERRKAFDLISSTTGRVEDHW